MIHWLKLCDWYEKLPATSQIMVASSLMIMCSLGLIALLVAVD